LLNESAGRSNSASTRCSNAYSYVHQFHSCFDQIKMDHNTK
jgi:hypothetical protein